MRELREDTFYGNRNENAHDHVDQVLNNVSFLHIPRVSQDAVLLRVFPFTLTGSTKRWVDRLTLGAVNTWDLLKKAFIQRKHFKTLSLDESRSPDFDLFSDQEEYSKEEVAETMEQYMSKTRADYGSGVARLKIKDKENFKLKGQFFKELRSNTFSNSDHEDANEHIEKVLEIVDLLHIPNITIDHEVVLFYNGLDVLTRQILDSIGAIPSMTDADAKDCTLMYETKQMKILFPSHLYGYYCEEKKVSYGPQFLEAYSEASHINNSIPRKEKDPWSFTLPCFINNVYFDKALGDLEASVSVMPLSTYLNLGLGKLAHTKLTVELADRTMKYLKRIVENVLGGIDKFVFLVDFIILDMPEDIKVPLILGRPFLSTANAKIDGFKRKITLRVREEQNNFQKRNNVVEALMSMPIFVGTFSVVMDFVVLEDMDVYRDEGMGDVIFGEPFLREVRIKARWFDGMITIYNGKLEPIDMVIEMANDTKCIPKGIVKNLLIKIDKFIRLVDFVILDMIEDFRMPVISGRPLLATAHAKVDIFRKTISLEFGNEKVISKMRSNFFDNIHESVRMIKTNMNTEEDELMKIDSDLFTYNTDACKIYHLLSIDPDVFIYDIEVQESFEELFTGFESEGFEDPDRCGESKENKILGTIINKLHDEWFKGTHEDDDDLEGIIDYLEPTLYDRFIDSDDEEYKKRKCRLLEMPYIKPPLILIEKIKVTRYSVGLGDVYTKLKVLETKELSRIGGNITNIRARIMEEILRNDDEKESYDKT
nr:hypothetical protein [Tanacetum cinerariifolium]